MNNSVFENKNLWFLKVCLVEIYNGNDKDLFPLGDLIEKFFKSIEGFHGQPEEFPDKIQEVFHPNNNLFLTAKEWLLKLLVMARDFNFTKGIVAPEDLGIIKDVGKNKLERCSMMLERSVFNLIVEMEALIND